MTKKKGQTNIPIKKGKYFCVKRIPFIKVKIIKKLRIIILKILFLTLLLKNILIILFEIKKSIKDISSIK